MPAGEGVGIDLVRIDRFHPHLQDDRFLARVFSDAERAELGEGPSRLARIAARWAAKEACAKALGCGIGDLLTWRDIEVRRSENGAPTISLSDSAAARHGHPVLLLSMSHDGDYATAIVWLTHRQSTPQRG